MRGTEHEVAGRLVEEVDEAGVSSQRIRDLARDEGEDFLEIERRVDGGDRLRQQPQMTGRLVDPPIVGAPSSRPLQKPYRFGR
jgi:hypothetical protein